MIGKIALPLILCALLVPDARAFHYPLSPEEVREAYFLGRNPGDRPAFFGKYIHAPALPDKGPNVQSIEFRTPYELVALRSQEHWANYNVLHAEQDYAARPSEVLIRVLIWGAPTFHFAAPPPSTKPEQAPPWLQEDYLRGFEFRVSQGHTIKVKQLTARNSCPPGCSDFGGEEAFLHFDAEQFSSGPVKIEVIAPGGQVFATTFDLDQLL
jgi:hypothetical protein